MAQAKKTVAKKQPSLKKPAAKKPAAKKPSKKKEQIKDARIILVFDRSGSMDMLIQDAIGTYNSFKKQQSELKGKTTWYAYMFDQLYETIVEGVDIKDVPDLTEKVYFARGSTAYLDALGKTITTFKASNDPKVKTILAIMTDGYENASREYTREQVKALVKEVQEKFDWEVLFFGANIDALGEGSGLGVARGSSAKMDNKSKGFKDLTVVLSAAATLSRGASKNMVEDYYFAATGKSAEGYSGFSGSKLNVAEFYEKVKQDTEESNK